MGDSSNIPPIFLQIGVLKTLSTYRPKEHTYHFFVISEIFFSMSSMEICDFYLYFYAPFSLSISKASVINLYSVGKISLSLSRMF